MNSRGRRNHSHDCTIAGNGGPGGVVSEARTTVAAAEVCAVGGAVVAMAELCPALG
jgi:hypothetical protein